MSRQQEYERIWRDLFLAADCMDGQRPLIEHLGEEYLGGPDHDRYRSERDERAIST